MVNIPLHWARLLVPMFIFTALLWAKGAGPAIAQDAPEAARLPDKSRYNLFNPTPTEFMREMSADRPDKTDCPFTVDTWLTYQLSRNVRLDAGVYIGVTPAADDWHPWLGMTWRY